MTANQLLRVIAITIGVLWAAKIFVGWYAYAEMGPLADVLGDGRLKQLLQFQSFICFMLIFWGVIGLRPKTAKIDPEVLGYRLAVKWKASTPAKKVLFVVYCVLGAILAFAFFQ